LAEANRSAKSSPAGSASQRPSTSHRTPVRAELVPRATNESFNRFACCREPGDTARQVRLFESPPPIPSVGPVDLAWRIGSAMKPSAGSLLEDPSQDSREVLHPSGLLDRAASRALREEISRTISRGPATLVVDLSNVSDVDAAGLDVLVYACRAATSAHVKLVLSSLPPLVLELLEPTRLSELGDVDIEPAVPIPLHITAA
jgi:anti-anti-sigma factor